MADSNPQNSAEAEGIPELEESPPGRDVELDEEALFVPRDRAVAAEGAHGYNVTAAEERIPEGVAERAAREEPDVGSELGVGGGVAGRERLDDDDVVESDEFSSVGRRRPAPHLYEPQSGTEQLEVDDEEEAIGIRAESRRDAAAFTAEESAVHRRA